MVQGYAAQGRGSKRFRSSFPIGNGQARRGRTETEGRKGNGGTHIVGPAREQRPSLAAEKLKLRAVEKSRGETWRVYVEHQRTWQVLLPAGFP